LRNVRLGNEAPLNSLLQGQEYKLCHKGLRKDTGGCLALCRGRLGLQRVRGAVAATVNRIVSVERWYATLRYVQEELGVAADNSINEGISVCRLLGDRLAEGKRIAARFVVGQVQMVGGDGC
jgi:hypothetical protein